MKTLTPGYKYLLNGFQNENNTQTIQFIEKTVKEETTDLETVNDDTTSEAVLEVLIDRIN